MPDNIVSTWMYVESADEGGLYPQVGGKTTSTDVQNIYWRCVYTFFWSIQTFKAPTTDLRLVLFTNVTTLPTVDGLDLNKALADFGVDIVTLQYTWAPKGSRKAWYNQYFLFDILEHCARTMADDDAILVMDNDCLTVRDLAPAFARLRKDGAILMTVGVTEDEEANGISRRGTVDVYAELGSERPSTVPEYFGGEFYGLTGSLLRSTMTLATATRAKNDALAASGAAYLSDEAHLFSYLMWALGHRAPNANDIVRRIWTTWKKNDTRPSDLDLTIWHLPSEKTASFKTLYKLYAATSNSSHPPRSTLDLLAAVVGVGRKRPLKFIQHFVAAIARSVSLRVS